MRRSCSLIIILSSLVVTGCKAGSLLTIDTQGAVLPLLDQSINSIQITSSNFNQTISVCYNVTATSGLMAWQLVIKQSLTARFINFTVPSDNIFKKASLEQMIFQVGPCIEPDRVTFGCVVLSAKYVETGPGVLCDAFYQLTGTPGNTVQFLIMHGSPEGSLLVDSEAEEIPFYCHKEDSTYG